LLVLILSSGLLGVSLLAFAFRRKWKKAAISTRSPFIRREADRVDRADMKTKIGLLTDESIRASARTEEIERWHNGFLNIAEHTGNQLMEIYAKIEGLEKRVRELEGKRFTQP